MKFALASQIDKNTLDLDVSHMERLANQYVSQQIFNILTAQAPTTDYNPDYFKAAGIDVGETIRLDPNDLQFSLSGPIAVAYAEAPANTNHKQNVKLNMSDILYRAIGLPTINPDTQAIEGLSLLPEDATIYRDRFSSGDKIDWASFGKGVNLFLRSPGVVAIVSLPTDVKLPYKDLSDLKDALRQLFPNTKLLRYALVIGASPHISLTVLISQSPVTCDESYYLVSNFIVRCLSKEKNLEEGLIEEAIQSYIVSEEDLWDNVDKLLSDYEDPSEIMNANWSDVKAIYEQKYREIVPSDSFISVDNIRVSKKDVKDALSYMRNSYTYTRQIVRRNSISNPKPGGK
jgi:hypothetical protein